MSYTLHIQTGTVTRDLDGLEVAPCQSATDPDYIAYVRWVEDGNDPRIVDYPTPPVPQTVPMRQARLALLAAGLLDDVDAAIAAIPDEMQRRAAQIEWEFASDVVRDSSLVALLGQALGLDDAGLDGLFIEAGNL